METIVVGIVSFLIGLALGFFGHWLALDRDKRKEFNEAAQPIRAWLLQQEKAPSTGSSRPSPLEMDTFVSCLSSGKRKEFRAALADYTRACGETSTDSYGEMSYVDPEEIRAHARRLLPFTDRRQGNRPGH